MKLRFYIFCVCLVGISVCVNGQSNNRVVIIAKVSGYSGYLLESNVKEWQGNDTIVPSSVLRPDGKRGNGNNTFMGVKYITADYPIADEQAPNNDSATDKKIWRSVAQINNNVYKWNFIIDKPRLITNSFLLGGSYLVCPGDSICVNYDGDDLVFTGTGASKFQILFDINKKERIFNRRSSRIPRNINDYLDLNLSWNNTLKGSLSILEKNRSAFSQFEYEWVRAKVIGAVEGVRSLYFGAIPRPVGDKAKDLPYTTEDLIRVWDSTMYKPEASWYFSDHVQNLPFIGNPGASKTYFINELNRDQKFQDGDTINNVPVWKKLIYEKMKSRYTGLFRERLLCYFLREQMIQEGFAPYNWFMKSIMDDYYVISLFPAYKGWMKQYERRKETRYENVTSVGPAPLFYLKDLKGNNYSNNFVNGKVVIFNFWYNGCKPCQQTAKSLSRIQEKYKNDTNVIFLNISVDSDRNKWEKGMKEMRYVTKNGIQLYTSGQGKNHEIVKDFNVTDFPTIRVIDQNGSIVIDGDDPFAKALPESQLSALIGRELTKFDDGPYVFFEQNKTEAYFIHDNKAEHLKPTVQFASLTDQYDKPLKFTLQKDKSLPASNYTAPSKLLVLSDIEGNFSPFRKLLQSSKVIDENFNWIFGDGHLVFAGDMFDRGSQVTECLWLIYSLEEKAKQAGGLVHFIMGNHEIMNLQGYHRYVEDKYRKSAGLMGRTLTDLYSENSELGKWLRTKNIVEKIGDILFMHGGISADLNNTAVTLEEINDLARPHYSDTTGLYNDAKVNVIMSSSVGPFWYRGYYEGKPAEGMIDSTLQKFKVNQIVTGHTIVADTISVHYSGKVINTDTRHASGQSEALFIKNNKYYRVNAKGKQILLFIKKRNIIPEN